MTIPRQSPSYRWAAHFEAPPCRLWNRQTDRQWLRRPRSTVNDDRDSARADIAPVAIVYGWLANSPRRRRAFFSGRVMDVAAAIPVAAVISVGVHLQFSILTPQRLVVVDVDTTTTTSSTIFCLYCHRRCIVSSGAITNDCRKWS